jgi:C4-dicarboxylate-specific signal transduction histidine kinase
MTKITTISDNLQDSYLKIYEGLADLRESFHRSGRLDDSNAKLDEISKLFATYLAYKNGQIKNFPSSNSENMVLELQKAFLETAKLVQYRDKKGGSIFGQQPSLILRADDEALAEELVNLTRNSIDLAFAHKKTERPFDLINEAFGHFVRD